ncbi:MAG TPA: RagB/SusD family nutrient uptake outer membrane protein [Gemmatimonadales bacterium]|nr:RagB/SusD family nutrient uptake outer membrane protein [Gemmatimonadales bacterium]
MNLRIFKALAVAAPLLVAAAACTDPTVAPKSTVTGANIWNDPNSYAEYMAKLYGGLVLTGQIGPNGPGGEGDISQIDEGTSEYLRLNWYLQELPTDEAVIGWNDPGVPDLNLWTWTSTNTIANAMYYRVYYQVVLANEFLRQTTASLLASRGVSTTLKTQIQQYRAEARFLRALAYWNGIDFFGGIPFVTEADPVGGPPPKEAARDSIYRYVVSELSAIKDSLPLPSAAVYGRATTMAAHMLLAELYLNAGVYTGTANYAGALTEAGTVINSGYYSLNPVFHNNFTSDNNLSPEIIFAALEDGSHTQTWGGMTFLVHAGCGGSMQASWFGMDYCWGGYRMKQQARRQFSAGDARGAFIYGRQTAIDSTTAERMRDSVAGKAKSSWTAVDSSVTDSVINIGSYNYGAAGPKFTNMTSTGGPGSQTTMIDTDFPIFRLGEAYLIYAEAAVRTNTNLATALGYFNALRQRAYGNASANIASAANMTTDTLLAERTRELLFEGKRRTDLIRFGKFTGGSYLWAWKGNTPGGAATDAHFNLYPLPANELSANPNLTQNPGY